MHIDKAAIVATLRARGLQERADWVERQLPDAVDVAANAALLRMLDIDPASLPAVDPSAPGPDGPRPDGQGVPRDAPG